MGKLLHFPTRTDKILSLCAHHHGLREAVSATEPSRKFNWPLIISLSAYSAFLYVAIRALLWLGGIDNSG